MDKIKPLIPYILLILAGFGAFILLDLSIEKILGAVGLGSYGVAKMRSKAKEAEAVADEHELLGDFDMKQAAAESVKADEVHAGTQAISDGIKPLDYPVKPGKTRKKFKAT